jgi:hypothetical protein
MRTILLISLFAGACATDPPLTPARLPARCVNPPPATGPDGALVPQLSKETVVATMRCVQGGIIHCYALYKEPTLTMVHVVAPPEGGEPAVVVPGRFGATPEGICVRKAVERAQFPAYGGEPMQFDYPFMLN